MLVSTNMKKLATLIAVASLSLAAPAFACPHDDAAAPKTAEKGKATPKDAPKAEAPKTETAKAKEAPKKAEEPKKPEKVSQK